MAYWNSYRPYVPVHERRANALRSLSAALGQGVEPRPIEAFRGRKMARTFWGEAWCENLETFSDYENRLPRGRTYARNGSIVHLEIGAGKVSAFVAGSDLYRVTIAIEKLAPDDWESFKKRCAGGIDTLFDLLRGQVSDSIIREITDLKTGLFPSPAEITLNCSCPDWAVMCKHVAAVLYGVGVRLDSEPELFFKLREVDHAELLDCASADAIDEGLPMHEDVLETADLSEIFGIEFSEIPGIAGIKKMRAARARVRG